MKFGLICCADMQVQFTAPAALTPTGLHAACTSSQGLVHPAAVLPASWTAHSLQLHAEASIGYVVADWTCHAPQPAQQQRLPTVYLPHTKL